MANSSWFNLTNECLRYAVLPTIASTAIFDDDTQLQQFQFAAKYYVRLAHKFLTLRALRHFTTRRIALNVFAGTSVYPLDIGIGPQGIKYQSFYNVTTGGTQNQPLQALAYEQFLQMYPDQSKIPTGPPIYWVLLPIERSQKDPSPQNIQIVPTPDQSYSLQYRAQILPYALSVSTDTVLWPPEYEHCLTLFAWDQEERALGEGKEGNIQALARQAVDEVHLIAGLPDDLRPAVRTMQARGGVSWPPGRVTGWVDSPLG
jgi:hypothetical protein